MARYPVIIGRAEHIDVVGIAIGVPAKVDSGAFRSAIHAKNITIKQKDGKDILTCELLGHKCSPIVRRFETEIYNTVTITNSFGQDEKRYEVTLRVKLGPKSFNTSFTLADRSNNLFPILVGRKILKNRYLVDVSKSTINRIKLKKEFGITSATDAEDLED